MVDTKPLLKGFGATADVAGQIATDKAVNSRRTRSSFTQFDIANGQLLEDVVPDPVELTVSHGLNRVPSGALVLKSSSPGNINFVSATSSALIFDATGTVTVWVV